MLREPTSWVLTRSDTNQPVESQKIARSFKFQMKEEEGFYYPCSENQGTDKLCGYREARLRLFFHIYALLVFLRSGTIIIIIFSGQ